MKKIWVSLFSFFLFCGFFKNENNTIEHDKLGKILISTNADKSQIIKNIFSPENILVRKVVFDSKTRKILLITTYLPTGELSKKIEYLTDKIQHTFFYPNGNVSQIIDFNLENIPLKQFRYHENGILATEGEFNNSWLKKGIWKSYDLSGKQIERIEYDSNGTGFFYDMQGNYFRKDSKTLDGITYEWFFQSGVTSNLVKLTFATPSNPMILFQTLFYENGNIKEKGYLTPQWERTGIWEFYDENGNLIDKKEQGA
jgi:antitoxin component YwqK of YwqJK toxin-antitoxin module